VNRLLTVLLLVLALPSSAQDLLVRNATVHTAGPQGTLRNHDVLVQGGVVRAIGPGLSAPANTPMVDARARPLTPGLFGGLTGLGIEEVSGEPATVDVNLALGTHVPPHSGVWRPEFDVSIAYNPRSAAVPVNRVEGITFTVLTPGSMPGGSFISGQGSAVVLDGRFDAALEGSRSLFIALGGDALPLSGGSRAGQWMLLDQALSESRPSFNAGTHGLLTPA
jgi:hypothetical protein